MVTPKDGNCTSLDISQYVGINGLVPRLVPINTQHYNRTLRGRIPELAYAPNVNSILQSFDD